MRKQNADLRSKYDALKARAETLGRDLKRGKEEAATFLTQARHHVLPVAARGQ